MPDATAKSRRQKRAAPKKRARAPEASQSVGDLVAALAEDSDAQASNQASEAGSDHGEASEPKPSGSVAEEALDAQADVDAKPTITLEDTIPIDPDDDLSQVEGEASLRLVSIIESLLFAAPKPMRVKDLRRLLKEPSTRQIQLALKHLQSLMRDRGVVLGHVAGGFRLRTHPDNAQWVQQLMSAKPVRLTRSQLESLAIIAYRQPITKAEIDHVRGVDCGAVLKVLLDRELIKYVGRKEEAGRPHLYGTTVAFLEFFNLTSLRDMPDLQEFRELSAESEATLKQSLGDDTSMREAMGQERLDFSDEDSPDSPSVSPESDSPSVSPESEEDSPDSPSVSPESEDDSLDSSFVSPESDGKATETSTPGEVSGEPVDGSPREVEDVLNDENEATLEMSVDERDEAATLEMSVDDGDESAGDELRTVEGPMDHERDEGATLEMSVDELGAVERPMDHERDEGATLEMSVDELGAVERPMDHERDDAVLESEAAAEAGDVKPVHERFEDEVDGDRNSDPNEPMDASTPEPDGDEGLANAVAEDDAASETEDSLEGFSEETDEPEPVEEGETDGPERVEEGEMDGPESGEEGDGLGVRIGASEGELEQADTEPGESKSDEGSSI